MKDDTKNSLEVQFYLHRQTATLFFRFERTYLNSIYWAYAYIIIIDAQCLTKTSECCTNAMRLVIWKVFKWKNFHMYLELVRYNSSFLKKINRVLWSFCQNMKWNWNAIAKTLFLNLNTYMFSFKSSVEYWIHSLTLNVESVRNFWNLKLFGLFILSWKSGYFGIIE